ncbi:cell division protein ZipA [Vibrio porteresiae]|uniref:Cell division protein ZipA n=1 Tax=Vibrio porteresiae DSM 19223 TaxID=1123496 RepID=A0ABZ0QC15_9VIBR|nr:cell division protein ZipA [Vibrio porteresiae]WPC73312.1 cell division protein ZipA [Vibrio porteresiae DSM 19223]
MQELRFVLIIVGGLAIAALLFHGLWTSKKEGKSKFGERPLQKIDVDQEDEASLGKQDTAQAASRKEPNFGDTESDAVDPLIGSFSTAEAEVDEPTVALDNPYVTQETAIAQSDEVEQPAPIESDPVTVEPVEDELEVLVLNVHCAGNHPFVGTKLFDSMQQNGLLYGEMHIFHRHADLSGTGKVLFSVANMMQPGTLEHDDPDSFTTKGISFFMTLPCFGDAEQNFKLMLKTAQQIADDMGGNVLDDGRNLMTPDRLAEYRQQIRDYKARKANA